VNDKEVGQMAHLLHHLAVPVLLYGIPGDMAVHGHHPDFDVNAHLFGGFAHLLDENLAVAPVKVPVDGFGLPVLVQVGIDLVADLPAAEILIPNLPDQRAPLVVTHPVGGIPGGHPHRILAGPYPRIGVVDADISRGTRFGEQGVIVVDRHGPAAVVQPILQILEFISGRQVLGAGFLAFGRPEIVVGHASPGPADHMGIQMGDVRHGQRAEV